MTNYKIVNKKAHTREGKGETKVEFVVDDTRKGASAIIARAKADPLTYDIEEIKENKKPEKSGA